MAFRSDYGGGDYHHQFSEKKSSKGQVIIGLSLVCLTFFSPIILTGVVVVKIKQKISSKKELF